MSREYRVLPECDGDTLMINLLGFKNPNHQFGISVVAKAMQENFATRIAVGIVDNDKKNHPKYFSSFEILDEKHNLILKKHPTKKHYLIFLNPAFDTWIWNHAIDNNIDPSRFKIRDFKYFMKLTKNQNVHKNENVRQFINALKQKKNSPLNTLENWIKTCLDE